MTDLIVPQNGDQPTQPTAWPALNFAIVPDGSGVVIRIIFQTGLTISQAINEADMNVLCATWLETRREVKRMQQLAQDVIRTKQRG